MQITAGKCKTWTSCDSVSLRSANAWTSVYFMQSNGCINMIALVWLRTAVISESLIIERSLLFPLE